ncbi:hypothetical protein [Aureimonas sp. AU40]|uniref:hypothetical protein n=1 Tax=Aureimonas sp. AU40 TaxID=1637747 RepID=UPI000780D850|nr:hypothetical protein [Aureimonas sp. AU40]
MDQTTVNAAADLFDILEREGVSEEAQGAIKRLREALLADGIDFVDEEDRDHGSTLDLTRLHPPSRSSQ